jgi:hypothetical protein
VIRDIFTAEETNLLYIYDTGEREGIMNGLIEDLDEINDPEMVALFVSTIEKLETMTDETFEGVALCLADDHFFSEGD